jgi:hypothetical protein
MGIEEGINRDADRAKKIEPGRFAEGPRNPGLSCPPPQCASKKSGQPAVEGTTSACRIFVTPEKNCTALPAVLREKGKRPTLKLGALFFASQEFVALNSSHYAYRTLFTWLGALHASETPHTHWTRQSNFVWKRQEYFNSRTFFHIFLKEKIHPAGADIARFCTCFTNGRTCSPTNGERKAHGKALGSAAF